MAFVQSIPECVELHQIAVQNQRTPRSSAALGLLQEEMPERAGGVGSSPNPIYFRITTFQVYFTDFGD
jgi:hypothetical protein